MGIKLALDITYLLKNMLRCSKKAKQHQTGHNAEEAYFIALLQYILISACKYFQTSIYISFDCNTCNKQFEMFEKILEYDQNVRLHS